MHRAAHVMLHIQSWAYLICWNKEEDENNGVNSEILNFVAWAWISFASHLYRTLNQCNTAMWRLFNIDWDWNQCWGLIFLFVCVCDFLSLSLWFHWDSKHFGVFLSMHFIFSDCSFTLLSLSLSLISFGHKLRSVSLRWTNERFSYARIVLCVWKKQNSKRYTQTMKSMRLQKKDSN